MKIVFVGNCQAYGLSFLYERHIGSALGQATGWVDAWNEHRLDDWRAELADADLVAVQTFSSSTRVPVDELCEGLRRIDFPDVRGNFLWPYGNVPRVDNPSPSYKSGGPYDPEVGDSFLNRLIADGVPPEDALARYLDHDIVNAVSLDRLVELSLDRQRARDARTGFSLGDYIESRFRAERLFNTQGHLGIGLFHRLARQLYERLDAPAALIDAFVAAVPDPPFELYHDAPVHPAVIGHLRLECIDTDTLYHHVQEGSFTFAERVIRYMDNAWSPELHEGASLIDRDPARAVDLIERGMVRAPGSAYGYSRKAAALQLLGRLDEALAAMRLATEIDPDNHNFRAQRIDVEHRLAEAR